LNRASLDVVASAAVEGRSQKLGREGRSRDRAIRSLAD
jgi:hypothetical protein